MEELIEEMLKEKYPKGLDYYFFKEEMIGYKTALKDIKEQLRVGGVSQQRELLGCEHVCITVKGRDEGVCTDCGVEMIRTWQPNCG